MDALKTTAPVARRIYRALAVCHLFLALVLLVYTLCLVGRIDTFCIPAVGYLLLSVVLLMGKPLEGRKLVVQSVLLALSWIVILTVPLCMWMADGPVVK